MKISRFRASVIAMTVALMFLGTAGLAQSSQELRVGTRFGTLSLDGKSRVLFNGSAVEPPVQANSGIDVGEPFHIGARDVVLVTIIGGTACPYLYHFVTVTKAGAAATQSFGTCNEATDVRRSGNSIRVAMRGYRGPFEPPAERIRVEKQTHTFIFLNGVVTENGKPAK